MILTEFFNLPQVFEKDMDAYDRDVANSTSGFGKNSQAYRADGGANDERHDLDQQSNTWYIRLNGKLIKDKSGNPYSFQNKAAANKAALTMQAKLFNKDKEFMLTTNPNDKSQGVAEGSLNELAPSPGFGGDDDDKYTPADYGKPFKANYLGQNKFEVFCRKPQDPSNVIKLNAEVQKYGLEWEDDFGFWFLDSPGAVYLSWKYGEIPLPKAIDQARNPGHIHDLVTDYLTNSPHAAEIQKIATEYFGFTADGEMNEGVAEGEDYSPVTGAITRRIITQHPEVLAKYGPAVVSQAIDEIADFVGDVDEIGSSDVSGWVSQVIRSLARFAPVRDETVAEGSQRVDSLVTDALKVMRGSEVSDAVAALKTVLGNREYNDRRGHYNFYVRQLMDMYSQQDMANDNLTELSPGTLASYKNKAGADATAADKRGDIARGNKRFSGIVKATIKQGEQDAKQHPKQSVRENRQALLKQIIQS